MTEQSDRRSDKPAALNQSDLRQFCGSSQFFPHWTRLIVYTEGVQHMADRGGAYWLVDAIASYQPDRRIASQPDLAAFQLWELAVAEDKTATLTMRPDSGQAAVVTQEIPFTDFPLNEVTLYVCNGTLMLPSEY